MDWFTILLIFIFFILPLIQQVMEARRRGGGPPIETEDPSQEEDWVPLEEVDFEGTAEARPKQVKGQGQGDRFESWGSWPTEAAPAPQPEPLKRPERSTHAADARAEKPWSTPAPDPSPKRAEVPWSVPGPEPSSKPAEAPWRLPDPRTAAPAPSDKPRPESTEIPWRIAEPKRPTAPVVLAPVRPYRPAAPVSRRREAPPLKPLPGSRGVPLTYLQKMRDPAELKKTIIMNEILRPPKSLDGS